MTVAGYYSLTFLFQLNDIKFYIYIEIISNVNKAILLNCVSIHY